MASSIDFLEGYANRAIGLTIASKDFGFGDVRTSNNSGDIEGVVKNIRTEATNAANNMDTLVAKGYSDAKQTALIIEYSSKGLMFKSFNVGCSKSGNFLRRVFSKKFC